MSVAYIGVADPALLATLSGRMEIVAFYYSLLALGRISSARYQPTVGDGRKNYVPFILVIARVSFLKTPG
jgi:hypothetical protein